MLNHTLAISWDQDKFVNDYLLQHTKVLIPFINHESMTIFGVDLNVLPIEPVNLRSAFIKWLIKVNEPRLRSGQDLMITYEIVKRCPLWKITPMPFRALSLNRRALNKPVGTIGSIASKSGYGISK